MTEKVNGITLRAVNYKDSDKILTVFTLEKGKITVSARGVRKANAKMKQISEPFCFAESVLAEKSGRFTVTEINSYDAFYPIRCDLSKYT
jgi:DNA repair protein RecO (recombination protein O)